MKRFNINLPDELYESLRKEAFKKRVSMTKLIVETLDPEIDVLDVTYNKVVEGPLIKIKKGFYPPLKPTTGKDTFTVKKAPQMSGVHFDKGVLKKDIKLCKHGAAKGLCKQGCV